jgi:hypothetical protein
MDQSLGRRESLLSGNFDLFEGDSLTLRLHKKEMILF